MTVYSTSATPATAGTVVVKALVAQSPAPSGSPTFVRAALPVVAPRESESDVVARISEMLGRGPERAKALIQTLVANRSTNALGSAFKRDPSLLDSNVMLTLAQCGAGREFALALQLRPDLATHELALDLTEGRTKPRFLAALIQARPELGTSLST